MKILLIGSGGREHALAWKLAQSQQCEKLYCTPGNAGIADVAECVPIEAEDIDALVAFAKERAVDLVVIGPEAPLVLGLTDKLQEAGIAAFGPSQQAAQIEGSKGFMKDLCAKYGIPTAAYGRFTDLEDAERFIAVNKAPLVVKTDGLAAGKGVLICETKDEAEKAACEMLSGAAFGAAGESIVIEEFLEGEEVSYFVITDGKTVLPLASAQDHKRIGEGDTGLNTGGMGAYSPARLVTPELEQRILKESIEPLLDGMRKESMPYCGVLFAGLMIAPDGAPKLLEYNARFGDPECEAIMLRFEGDLAALLLAATQGRLEDETQNVRISAEPSICVVAATQGYPGHYTKNTPISGTDKATAEEQNVQLFHAGTARNEHGDLVSIGGRVLVAAAKGADLQSARDAAYRVLSKIDWPEMYIRKDIGWRALGSSEDQERKRAEG